MKAALAALGLIATTCAPAQTPDIVIAIDGRMQFLTQSTGPTFVRFYDNLGRHSLGSLRMFLEPGFQGYISQKFARIPGDADKDQLDEYYLEDEGIWRIGKQYLPFGSGRFLRETAIAARGDTQLLIEAIPVILAVCDNGPNRQRGVVGRIGSRIGVSFAIGKHFGINATSFTLVRRPEESPGVGRGHREIYGFDVSRNLGSLATLGAEIVIVRAGETAADGDNTLFDFTATFRPAPGRSLLVGWTRDTAQHADFYRAIATLFVSRYLTLEPIVRYRGGELFDAALTLNFKF